MISQRMSKQTSTSTTKDQDIQIPDITLILPQSNLSNSSKLTTPTSGPNLSEDKTFGKLTKEEYTMDHSLAGGSYQTLSIPTTSFTNKRPASLSLSQQLPPNFSSFLPAPTPQIIQLQWKDNRKKLMSLLAKPSRMRRGSTLSLIPLTAYSKETLHSYLRGTETNPQVPTPMGPIGSSQLSQ